MHPWIDRALVPARSGCAAFAAIATLAAAATAHAQQTFYDDFADGEPSQYWQVTTGAPSLSVDENDSHLEFRTEPDPALVQRRFSGYVARNWSLRTTSNFFVRMYVHSAPVQVGTAVNSEHGVAVGFAEAGNPAAPNGFPTGGGVMRIGAWRKTAGTVLRRIDFTRHTTNGAEIPYWTPFITEDADTPLSFYVNGNPAQYAFDFAITEPIYFRYNSASDTLFVSTFSFNDPNAFIVPGFTQGLRYPVAVVLGGYAQTPATMGGAHAWVDSFGVESASIDAAPASVAASDGTFSDKVRITWGAAPNAVGYKVFRQRGSDAPVQLTVGALGAAARTFDDTQVDPSVEYTYLVRTVTAQGDGFEAGDTGWKSFPAPTGIAASDGTFTDKVVVSWTEVAGAVAYSVWRGVGSAAPTEISAGGGVAGTTFEDTTATPAFSYKYFVRTISTLGPSALSTPDTGYRGFLPPAEVSASDGTFPNKIEVSWTQAAGATAYKILRRVGTGAAASIATVQGGATLLFNDTTAPALTEVFYSVQTVTAVGTSASSAETTGWRNSAAPTNVAASAGTSAESIAVNWTLPANSTGCEVYRAVGSGAPKLIATLGVASTYGDTSADPLVSYKYTVRAIHAFGTSPTSVAATGWRNAEPPTGVLASEGDFSNKVRVAWDAFPGATGYRVYRRLTSSTAAPQLVKSLTGGGTLAWDDTTAQIGKNYTYQVTAKHALGFTGFSAGATGWRNAAAPANVQATDGTSATQVTVTWGASTGATGYYIYRQLGAEEPIIVGERTASQSRNFADTTAEPGVEYRYTVSARTSQGQSTRTAGNTGWRNLAKPLGVLATDGEFTDRVVITWQPVDFATGYRVYRQFGTSQNMLVATVEGRFTTTTEDLAVPPITNAKYTVRALCALGSSTASAVNTGWRNREAPAGVEASDGTYPTKVRVSWTGVPNATSYRIYRQIGADDPAVIGTVSGALLSFYDTGIAEDTVATYFVQARHALGSTALSEPDDGFRGTAGGGLLASDGEGPDAPPVAIGGDADGGTSTDDDGAGPNVDEDEGGGDGAAGDAACAMAASALTKMLSDAAVDAPLAGVDAETLAELALLLVPESEGTPPPVCSMHAGDVDLDGDADLDDLTVFLEAWTGGDLVRGDIDRDGKIDGSDFLRMAVATADIGSAESP